MSSEYVFHLLMSCKLTRNELWDIINSEYAPQIYKDVAKELVNILEDKQ